MGIIPFLSPKIKGVRMNNHSGVVAAQKINTMYANSFGNEAKQLAVNLISVLIYIATVVSVVASAYGVYHDLYVNYGEGFALTTGVIVGVAIEVSKVAFLIILWVYKQWWMKAIALVMLVFTFSSAFALHNVGGTNLTKNIINEKVAEIQKRRIEMQGRVASMAEGMVQNGSIADDKIAMETMASIVSQDNQHFSKLEQLEYDQTVKAAESRGYSLKLLGPLFEVLSVFGFFKYLLIFMSVAGGIRRVVEKKNEYDSIQAFHYEEPKTVIDSYAEHVETEIDNKIKEIHSLPSPTLFETITKRANTMASYGSSRGEVADYIHKHLDENEAKKAIKLLENFPYQDEIDPKTDQNLKAEQSTTKQVGVDPEPTSKPTETSNEEECEKEELFEEQEEGKKQDLFVINLMNFTALQNEIIKAMFGNGSVQEGDMLVPKTKVMGQLKIKRREYEAVAETLENGKHIFKMKGNGYMALSTIDNIVTTRE